MIQGDIFLKKGETFLFKGEIFRLDNRFSVLGWRDTSHGFEKFGEVCRLIER
jgi:hypothetical protein